MNRTVLVTRSALSEKSKLIKLKVADKWLKCPALSISSGSDTNAKLTKSTEKPSRQKLWRNIGQKKVGKDSSGFPRSQIFCTVTCALKNSYKAHVSPTCSLLHFRETVSFNARRSQSSTTYGPRSCPRRGSPHHKIVMHVNFMVHGSNEPWRWMLSDFKRLHPRAPPPRLSLPSTWSVRGMCSPDCVGQRIEAYGSGGSGEVTCIRDFLTCSKKTLANTQALAHNSAEPQLFLNLV